MRFLRNSALRKPLRQAVVATLGIARSIPFVRSPLNLPSAQQFSLGSESDSSIRITAVDSSQRYSRTLPKIAGVAEPLPEFSSRQKGNIPASFVAELTGAYICGLSDGTVFTADRRLVPELSKDAWGAKLHSAYTRPRLSKPRHLPGKTLALITPEASSNYYHWMLDLLPRASLAQRAGFSLSDFDQILLRRADLPFQRETLTRLGISLEKIRILEPSDHFRADRLVVPSLRITCQEASLNDIDFLRTLHASSLSEKPNRRLYIGRKDAAFRRVTNEPNLLARLKPHGFEEISMAGLTVAQQAKLFSEAEIIVAPNGAALANLVFAPASARVFELFSPDWVAPFFWTICADRGLPYAGLVGTGPHSPSRFSHAALRDDITVDLEAFDAAFAEFLN